MALRRMQISAFRCLHSAGIVFDPRFTLISGPNASGKTSVLEAIYVLSRGRSFRTRHLENLVESAAEKFVLVGEATAGEAVIGLGIEGSAEGMRARVHGRRAASLTELASVLPVQVIDPEVHRLIEEGPSRRRRFLDWGVFHVEHGFVALWQQYQQVLRQRNAALRSQQPRPVVGAWDGELLRLGLRVTAARRSYVEMLAPVAAALVQRLVGMTLGMSYRAGWARELSFDEALRASWGRDAEIGSTSVGPQRADLALRLDGRAIKERVSRGQQKLLAAALLVAQLRVLPDSGVVPSLLLDDPAAELDADHLKQLIDELAQQSVQLIVTTLDESFLAFGAPGLRYSIRGGAVAAI